MAIIENKRLESKELGYGNRVHGANQRLMNVMAASNMRAEEATVGERINFYNVLSTHVMDAV